MSSAQSDKIYPTTNKKDIRRCNIIEVKNNNVVYYQKGSETDSVEAIAIIKDDIFISLKSSSLPLFYKNYDYNYYQKKFKRALISRNTGIAVTGIGIGLIILSYPINQSEKKSGMGRPLTIILATGALLNVSFGIAIWSSNAIKAINNKKAMEMTKPNASLCLGKTKSGIGITLNF